MLVAFRPYDFGNARWQREGRKVDRSFPKMKFHLGNRKLKNLNFDIEFRPVDWISCVIKYPVIFLLWCTIEIYPTNHAWCPLRASKPPKTWFHAIVPLFWTLSTCKVLFTEWENAKWSSENTRVLNNLKDYTERDVWADKQELLGSLTKPAV